MSGETAMSGHTSWVDVQAERQLVAQAREHAASAGFPLQDRYGYPARHDAVMFILDTLRAERDDLTAGDIIGMANLTGEIQVAESDAPASEEYEQGIITALRPLVAP